MKTVKVVFVLVAIGVLMGCTAGSKKQEVQTAEVSSPKLEEKVIALSLAQANSLAALPLACVTQEYPNKLGQVLGSTEDLLAPKVLHPAFYGCFDWHSAVHGHWSLVKLLKTHPNLEASETIKSLLQQNLSKENIQQELAYFNGPHNKNYERTYGWVGC